MGNSGVSVKIKVGQGANSNNIGSTPIFAIAGDASLKEGNKRSWIGQAAFPYYLHTLKLDEQGRIMCEFGGVRGNVNEGGSSKFRLSNNEWHTVEFVYDLSDKYSTSGNIKCAFYADGESYGTATLWDGVDKSFNKLYGLLLPTVDGVKGGGKEIYYDDLKVTLKTAVSDVECNEVSKNFDSASSKYNAELKIKNNSDAAKNYVCIVAAYGEQNELIGVYAGTEDNLAAGAEKTVSAVIDNVTESTVKSIKAYVWDTYSNMTPHMDSIPLYTAVELNTID